MAQPRTVTGSLLLVTALTLAGCASGGAASTASVPGGTPTSAATVITTPAAPARATTVSSTSSTTKAGLKPRTCGNADLRVAAGRSDGGMGHVGVVLLFRNVAGTGCEVRGYPGVAGLDGTGRQVAQASRTASGYLGGVAGTGTTPPTVTLTPGGTASALVEATDVPSGTAASCPTYASLLVTPPNTTAATHLTITLPGCSGLEVHPVVASTDGTQHG
jgi:hypothetical protein